MIEADRYGKIVKFSNLRRSGICGLLIEHSPATLNLSDAKSITRYACEHALEIADFEKRERNLVCFGCGSNESVVELNMGNVDPASHHVEYEMAPSLTRAEESLRHLRPSLVLRMREGPR